MISVSRYYQLVKQYDIDPCRVEHSTTRNLNFLGATAPNSSNSCYIDATFGLLWNAVLPFTLVENFDSSKNAFDDILVRSYKKYTADAVDLKEKKKECNGSFEINKKLCMEYSYL